MVLPSIFFNNYKIWSEPFQLNKLHFGKPCNIYQDRETQCHHLFTVEAETETSTNVVEHLTLRLDPERYFVRYLDGEINAVKDCIDNRITLLTDKLWHQINRALISPKYIDVLVLATSFAELWGMITTVINSEHRLVKYELPSELILSFSQQLSSLERAEATLELVLADFSGILTLRNAICKSLKEVYRVHYPTVLGRAVPRERELTTLYSPFDMEWLANSFKPSSTKQRWVHESRVNQWVALKERVCTSHVARFDDFYDFGEDDSDEEVYVPSMEEHLTEAEMDVHESTKKHEFQFNHDILRQRDNADQILIDTDCASTFLEIRGAIRKLKTKTQIELETFEPTDERRILSLQIIGVLSIVEANLLTLLHVYAQLADRRLGMYGSRLPMEVANIINLIMCRMTREYCEDYPIAGDLLDLIHALRGSVKNAIKRYYLEEFTKLEKIYQKGVDDEAVNIRPSIEASIGEEFASHRDDIIFNFKLEKYESDRLEKERFRAMRYRSFANQPGIPALKVNKLNAPGMLFLNYATVKTAHIVSSLPPVYKNEWLSMQAFNKKYPLHVINLIKREIHAFVFTSFGSLPKYVRDALAVGFCYGIIDHIAENELDANKKFIDPSRACRRINGAAIRLRLTFREVIRHKSDLMIDYGVQMTRITNELIDERSRRANGRMSDTFVPNLVLHNIATNFLTYICWCAKIKSSS